MADFENRNSNSLLSGTSAADSITNYGDWCTINTGEGNDYIDNDGAKKVTINGDIGDDYIHNYIHNGFDSNILINGGEGNDSIESHDSKVTISGGAGNDSIIYDGGYNSSINGGAGKDTIKFGYLHDFATIVGGKDDDFLYGSGAKYLINGDEGNDTIEIGWENGDLTISGGIGNDSIKLYNDNDHSLYTLFQYISGNDIIEGFNSTSTLQIASGKVSSVMRFVNNINDLCIAVGNDTITLAGVGNDSINLVDAEGKQIDYTLHIVGSENSDTVHNSYGAKVIVHGEGGDDFLNNFKEKVTIEAGAGNDSITNSGSEVIIAGGTGNDTILNTGGRNASLDGGDDDDFIYNGQNALYYEDSEGNCHYLEDEGVKSQLTQLESAISDTQKKNETAINESIAEIRTEIAQLEKNPPEGLSQNETSELKKNLDYYLKEIDTVKKLYLGTKIGSAFLEGISNTVKWLNEVHTTPIDWKKYYTSLPNEERDLAYLKSLVQSGKVKYAEDYVAIKSYLQNTYPDPSDYSKSYTKGKKILEIANSDKSVQQRLNDLGKLLKEKPTVPMKIQVQGASGLELFGFGLSVSEFALNYLNSFEEISEASDAAAYADFKDKWDVYQKELKSQLGASKYDKLNLSAMDAIGSGVGIIAGIAAGAGAAAAGATGLALLAPVIGAGLLVTGGTALAKTLYSTSQHKDASFWKTLGNNILPLSDSTYVQKKYKMLSEEKQDIVKMNGGNGDDTLVNAESNFVIISGGAGNDLIVNKSSENVMISGGKGNDTINNLNSSDITINAEEGDDQINNYSDAVKIHAGVGNNTIKSFDSKDVFIVADKGDDYIDNAGNSNTISAGDGKNIISNIGASVSIKTGKGSDEIDNLGVQVKIDSGAGNDYIVTEGNGVTVLAGAGKDIIENTDSSQVLIDTGNGDDYVESDGDANTIKSGSNDDIINSVGDSNLIDAGAGSDYIENIGDTNTVNGGGSKDYIMSVGEKNSLNAGSGDDYIENAGSFNTINADEGNDYIENSGDSNLIKGGAGNDLIFVGFGSDNTVFGGANNDIIFGEDSDDEFYGESGNDSLSGGKGNDTLSGGTGNDKLLGGDGDDLFVYSAGKDVIGDYATGDKISIGAAISKATVKGSNVVFTTDNGTLTVQKANGKTLSLIDSTGREYSTVFGGTTLTLTNDKEAVVSIGASVKVIDASQRKTAVKITGNAKANTIIGGKGNDTFTGGDGNDLFIYSAGKDVIGDYATGDKISIGAEISKATVKGSNVVFTTDNGTLTVQKAKGKTLSLIDSTGREYSTVVGGTTFTLINDKEAVVSVDASVKVIDASNRKTAVQIIGNKLANTIIGGKGNDTLTGGDGDDLFVYSAGKDVITDYATGDKISLGANISKATVKGSDVVFTVGKGSLTVQKAKGKTLSLIDSMGKEYSTVLGGTTLTLTNDKETAVSVGAAVKVIDASQRKTAVKIMGNAKANTIIGGKGNDTLTGGDGNDVFVYGAGKDVITDYATGDKISIGAAISKSTIKGSDVVFTVGKNTLTVKKAKGKTLSLIDSTGKEYSTVLGGTTLTLTNDKETVISVGSSLKVIDASKRKTAVVIAGNKLANTIYGGKGNDSLAGNAGNDKIYGGKGNDTLWGGAGNDSLWGDAGADTFIYSSGKDVIYGFDSKDTLTFDNLEFTASYKNKAVSFKFDIGSVTLKDFTTKTFHVNSDVYKISGSKLVK